MRSPTQRYPAAYNFDPDRTLRVIECIDCGMVIDPAWVIHNAKVWYIVHVMKNNGNDLQPFIDGFKRRKDVLDAMPKLLD